ncbi:TetR/AcrR family transcriptional regulator [Amycolatopsis pithecellobii]|uniref:TetR family transcriptional regulator n=1 Tax=Amycolatopsis pithecellobii TaxID=664692 RepID=A0A6N7Z0P6_9PSEU|nr:TetR/AcrR family transcriptional regulator [Amycolatopsis pithecellobii]MTD53351.1 TetR family transcriptional regulator [Amycolatopsis pithecellobii]
MGRPRTFDTDEVLTKALVMFWRQGYASTSTKDLCEGTNLGRGSLYHAFEGKQDIYLQALRRYYELGTAPALAILDGPEPVRERIRKLMTAVIDTDLADPDHKGCLAINAAVEMAGREPEVQQAVRRHFRRIEEALCATFRRAADDGEFSRDRDPVATARFVMSAYYGLRVLAKATDDREALLDVVRGTLDALA